jgi:hypothetical protein
VTLAVNKQARAVGELDQNLGVPMALDAGYDLPRE